MERPELNLFYSYSHKDEEARDELETHLSALARNDVLKEWHDRKIAAGQNWEKEIDQNLQSADIILLLLSADFIKSDYCFGKEVEAALEKENEGSAIVIPVILRPCMWTETDLASLQALPKDAKAVSTWDNKDEAWLNVVEGIQVAAKQLCLSKSDLSGPKKINELLFSEVDRLERQFKKKVYIDGLSTGFTKLDHAINGLDSPGLVLIGARPRMGKTDFCINLAANLSTKGKVATAYLSTHVSDKLFPRIVMSLVSQVDLRRITNGTLSNDDWPKLTEGLGVLQDNSLYFERLTIKSAQGLEQRITLLKNEHNVKCVVIDTLELGFDPHFVKSHIDALKSLAIKLNLIIVVACTLSESIDMRADRRPMLEDLSSIGDSYRMCDSIIFLYKDDMYLREGVPDKNMEIIVAKGLGGHMEVIHAQHCENTSLLKEL